MSRPEQESSLASRLSEGWVDRFERYVAGYRPTFQRADQFLRFRAYLRGLLEAPGRKNVEAIAAAAGRVIVTESNLAQALQHFVSHSPWDADRLFAAVRQSAAPRGGAGAAWVVHDGPFVKKGQHSVGVQPQFARALGKKVNCQVGVFVARVGPAGYFPLAARLYLPSAWLRDHAVGTSVPVDARRPASKAEIALRLIDGLRAEGEPLPVAGEPEYLSDAGFGDGVADRRLAVQADRSVVAEALRRYEWLRCELGLDHFEGRTWHGWHHHVGLVFAAYHFLSGEAASGDSPPFRSPSPSSL